MAQVAERPGEASPGYSRAISKGVAGLITGMSPFMVWKYFNTNPFKDHGVILSILIVAILVHLIFGFLIKRVIGSLMISFCICLMAGVIAIELILFILFTQIWKLIVINVSVALLVVICFFKQLTTFFRRRYQPPAPADMEMPPAPADLEMPPALADLEMPPAPADMADMEMPPAPADMEMMDIDPPAH